MTLKAFPTLLAYSTFFQPIDRRDVRMIERSDDLCFAPKSSESIRIRRHRCGEHLDRHLALQVRVGRTVDLSHAADTNLCSDFVDAESSSGCESQRGLPDYMV